MREVAFLSRQNAWFHRSFPLLQLLTIFFLKNVCFKSKWNKEKEELNRGCPCALQHEGPGQEGVQPPLTAGSCCCFSFLQCCLLNPSQSFFVNEKISKANCCTCYSCVVLCLRPPLMKFWHQSVSIALSNAFIFWGDGSLFCNGLLLPKFTPGCQSAAGCSAKPCRVCWDSCFESCEWCSRAAVPDSVCANHSLCIHSLLTNLSYSPLRT